MLFLFIYLTDEANGRMQKLIRVVALLRILETFQGILQHFQTIQDQ